MNRRVYLDWLRGIAVLIMIEAHTLDSWTRIADRARPAYKWAIVLGGFGAPIFLFLAGVALTLAAGSRLRKGLSETEVAALARRRGWQIFGLAFLFRLQSAVLGGGALPQSLFKVDILNVMGLSMLAAAALWALGRSGWSRGFLFVAITSAVAMLTPVIRATHTIDFLPDAIEAYLRPLPGLTTFTLFPWAGFLLGGAVLGLWLDMARESDKERRMMLALAVIGPAIAFAGYAASLLPPIYAMTSFWTSSPTFFFVRLGMLTAMVPVAYVWNAIFRGWSPMQEFGVASLFVYWIHVEMVYGVLSVAIHRRLSFEMTVVAFALFAVGLFGLVKLKDRVRSSRRRTSG